MRETKCPVCAGEVPRALLRSKTLACPTCKEPLRVREPSALLTIPFAACGYLLTYLVASLVGLKGNALFLVTAFVGVPATLVVAAVAGALSGWVFGLSPPLERDPGRGFSDGGILHIGSPPKPGKGPQ